jgi:hypothetical protein
MRLFDSIVKSKVKINMIQRIHDEKVTLYQDFSLKGDMMISWKLAVDYLNYYSRISIIIITIIMIITIIIIIIIPSSSTTTTTTTAIL